MNLTDDILNGRDTIIDFDLSEEALRFCDMFNTGKDFLLDNVTISADSSINSDVTLTTDTGMSITIAGINVDSGSGGPFDGYTNLGDFLADNPAAINNEFNPDNLST